MMLLAISLVTIMQIFSSGIKALPGVDTHTRAVFHAREKMEDILLSDIPPEPGVTQGSFDDGFQWKAEITDTLAEEEEEDPSSVSLFKIDIAVFWNSAGREKIYKISTLKAYLK